MREVVVRVWAWGACALGIGVACSNDSAKQIECGPGTMLSDSKCVPSADGSAPPSNGGATQGGGAGGTSTSAGGGTSTSGGTSAGAGMPGTGAMSGGGTGNSQDGGETDASSGTGTGGSAGSGGVPDDAGDAGNPVIESDPHWLVIYSGGLYAYDLTKVGDASASIQLTGFPPMSLPPFGQQPSPWSPDGRWLLSFAAGGGLVVRDMSGVAPGSPVPLGTFSSYNAYWSPDSKSIAVVEQGGALSVIDPLQATPIKKPIATGVELLTWAPKGNLLYYADASTRSVVRVVAGVPQTPEELTGSGGPLQLTWLPDGEHLMDSSGDGAIFDLRGTTPKRVPIASEAVSNLSASSDGSLITFDLTASHEIDVATLGPDGPGAAKALDMGATGYGSWVAGTHILLTGGNMATYAWLFGASGPAAPVSLPELGQDVFSSPGTARLVYDGPGQKGLYSIDLKQPQQGAVTLLPANQSLSGVQARLAPNGRTIAYPDPNPSSSFDGIRIQDAVTGAFSVITTAATLPGNMGFSPSGRLFVVCTKLAYPAGTAFNWYLFRIDGIDASAAIPTGGTASANSAGGQFFFQPMN